MSGPANSPGAEPRGGRWLVIAEPPEAGSTAADEAALLANMLRAIGVPASATSVVEPSAWPGAASPAGTACLILLGRAAAERVLGSAEPLGALRGRLHRWHDVPAVVTFSLAYLLRHPADKAKAWADLCLAVQAAEAPTRAPAPALEAGAP